MFSRESPTATLDELPVTRRELDNALEAISRRINGEVQQRLDDAFEGYKAHAAKLVTAGIASIPPMSLRSEKLLRFEIAQELTPIIRQEVIEALKLNVAAGPLVFEKARAETSKTRLGIATAIVSTILAILGFLLAHNRLTH